MKTQFASRLFLLALILVSWTGANAQTVLESQVPGDNFSLEGALSLFKQSRSPEHFEELLNASDSKVNNLDLNGDGMIDYVRVIDRKEGNVHIFILQAIISERESQDVAVIELEKLANGKAVLQITGDADVYGMETIIEPTEEVVVNAGTTRVRRVVNVWTWPSVQYVYAPYYTVWVSPWRWAYYPFGWRAWRPVAYYVYDPWWSPYRPYYTRCHYHRIGYIDHYYRPYRTTSVIVYHNHRHQIDRYRDNHRHDSRNSRNDRRDYAGNDNDRDQDWRSNRGSGRDNENGRTSNENGRTSFDRNLSEGAIKTEKNSGREYRRIESTALPRERTSSRSDLQSDFGARNNTLKKTELPRREVSSGDFNRQRTEVRKSVPTVRQTERTQPGANTEFRRQSSESRQRIETPARNSSIQRGSGMQRQQSGTTQQRSNTSERRSVPSKMTNRGSRSGS